MLIPMQVDERKAVDHQAQLLAFDRQNHMGASDRLASNLQAAIAEEADALMQEKRVVSSAVNIAENKSKIKVSCICGHATHSPVLCHNPYIDKPCDRQKLNISNASASREFTKQPCYITILHPFYVS